MSERWKAPRTMSEIGPGRGSKPRYLGRALTEAERARVYRARKAGKPVPVLDPFAELRAVRNAYEAHQDSEGLHHLLAVIDEMLEKHKC